jgi:autotransporter-associated beta strand protein
MRFVGTPAVLVAAAVLALRPDRAAAQAIPVFVVAGQSNALNYATDFSLLDSTQQAPQPTVLYAGQAYTGNYNPFASLNAVNWGTINGPTEVHSPPGPVYSGSGFGPEISAPLVISKALGGAKVGVTKFAVNNTGFGADIAPFEGDWSAPSGSLYTRLTSRVNSSISALPVQQSGTTGSVAALFWMQGERDALDENRADRYQFNLTTLINSFRSTYGNVPVVLGQIQPESNPWSETVRRAQSNVARLLPNVALVQTDDLERASGIPFATGHFSSQGTYELGVRFGQAFIDLTDVRPARPAGMNLVTNGSFEDYAVGRFSGVPGTQNGGLLPTNAMPSWTANGQGATLFNAQVIGNASHGQQFITLANGFFGNGNGGVTTSFSAANEQYTVFFDYSALASGAGGNTAFTYARNGGSVQTFSINTSGLSQNQMAGWVGTFITASLNGAQTIRFAPTVTADNGTYYGPAIDNVRIVEGPIWNLAGGGSWTTNGNWIGGNDPDGNTDNANFLWRNTGAASINLTTDREVKSIRFDSPHSYTIAGASHIDLNHATAGQNATILVGAGAHTIDVRLDLEDNLDIDVAGGATLTVNGQLAQITSARTITKFGVGNVVFANASNTHTGPTRVVEGTLALSAASSNNLASSTSITIYQGATLDVTGLSGGGITLADNQVLSGKGTVRGALTTPATGTPTLAPGTSAGKLTFSGPGDITLTNNSLLQFEIGGDGSGVGVAGLNFDQIVVDGTGKSFVTGNARLQITALPGLVLNQSYTIVTAVNGATINFSALFRNLAGTLTEGADHVDGQLVYRIDYENTSLSVMFSVPEPSVLWCVVLGVGLRRRWR